MIMRFTKEFCFAPVCSKFRVLILRHLIATISKYCPVFPVYAIKFFFLNFQLLIAKQQQDNNLNVVFAKGCR